MKKETAKIRGATTRVRAVPAVQDLQRRLENGTFQHHFEQRRVVHEIALAVRNMREAAGLTQAELATKIGTSQPALARLERGIDQRTPRWDTLNRIARALGKHLTLLFEPEKPKRSRELVIVAGDARPSAR